jgi:hypothetical protein
MPLGAFKLNSIGKVSAPASVTFVASSFQSATSNSSIVIPATAAAGDIAVLFDRQNTPTSGFVTPSGWTTIATRFVSSNKVSISYKVLTAGDPDLTITGQGTTARKIMAVYRPSHPINSVTVVTNSQGGNTSATTTGSAFGGFGNLSQNLTAETSRPILSYAFWSTGQGSTFTRSSTLTAEREITDGGGFTWARMFVFNSGSSTSTVNTISTGSGSAATVKFQFEGSLRLS